MFKICNFIIKSAIQNWDSAKHKKYYGIHNIFKLRYIKYETKYFV